MAEPAAGESSRLQAAAANFGVAVASALLFLTIAETGVRIWDRFVNRAPIVQQDPKTTLYEPHPYLPIVLKPDSDYRDSDTAGHINSLGLRGPERPAAKPRGTYRILCVGGSTTFGAGILGDENTWPARLEARLAAAHSEQRIEVWNAGVPGYTTAENVIYLSLRLLDFSPDLVIFFEGYNDFKPNRYPGFRSDYAHWRDRAQPPARPAIEGLRLYTKMKNLWARWTVEREAVIADPRTGEPMRRWDTVGEEGLASFRRNLKTMIAMARQGGAAVALATYPSPCTEENRRNRPELFSYLDGYLPNLTFAGVLDAFDRYNQAIRAVAVESKAILADPALVIPADPDLFVDHVHVNARGADAFAAVMQEAIEPALPQGAPSPDRRVTAPSLVSPPAVSAGRAIPSTGHGQQ